MLDSTNNSIDIKEWFCQIAPYIF